MKRFYVTMTWEDWPEGGSYGAVVRAKNEETAEKAVKKQMAKTRAEEGVDTAGGYMRDYAHAWYTVDCFDLDGFIEQHRKGKKNG